MQRAALDPSEQALLDLLTAATPPAPDGGYGMHRFRCKSVVHQLGSISQNFDSMPDA